MRETPKRNTGKGHLDPKKGSAATVLGSQRPFDAEDMRELFEIIDDQADRLRDLVDNILDMTRIEAGIMSLRTEPMDLREALDEALAALTRAGATSGYTAQGGR